MVHYLVEAGGISVVISDSEVLALSREFVSRWKSPGIRRGFVSDFSPLELAVCMLTLKRLNA